MKSNFINELHNDRGFLNSQNQAIIKNITDLCIKYIKLLNCAGNTNCIYEVPPLLLGYPLYDINIISRSINKNLKKLGLKTIYIEPNKIYISWKKI